MPFLEGTPCSIHGIVLADEVVALRPVEMLVLRQADGGLFYSGCASYFDPPKQHRESMRALARIVGAKLREEVKFRGAFTVDGVMTAVLCCKPRRRLVLPSPHLGKLKPLGIPRG